MWHLGFLRVLFNPVSPIKQISSAPHFTWERRRFNAWHVVITSTEKQYFKFSVTWDMITNANHHVISLLCRSVPPAWKLFKRRNDDRPQKHIINTSLFVRCYKKLHITLYSGLKMQRKTLKKSIRGFSYQQFPAFVCALQVDTPIIGADKYKWAYFAEYSVTYFASDAENMNKIFYSEECDFSSFDDVNKQKFQLWETLRPQGIYKVLQDNFSIITCCDLLRRWVSGRLFLKTQLRNVLIPKTSTTFNCFPASELLPTFAYLARESYMLCWYSCVPMVISKA